MVEEVPQLVWAGLAVGVALMHLPWKVHGVMLAGSEDYYNQQQQELIAAFNAAFGAGVCTGTLGPRQCHER